MSMKLTAQLMPTYLIYSKHALDPKQGVSNRAAVTLADAVYIKRQKKKHLTTEGSCLQQE